MNKPTSLRQKDQIKSSDLYTDNISDISSYSATNLEDDLNSIRTQIKNILGENSWWSTPKSDLITFTQKTNNKWFKIEGNTGEIEPEVAADSIYFENSSNSNIVVSNKEVVISNNLPYFLYYKDDSGNSTNATVDDQEFTFSEGNDIEIIISSSPDKIEINYDGPVLSSFDSWFTIQTDSGSMSASRRKDELTLSGLGSLNITVSSNRITISSGQDISTTATMDLGELKLSDLESEHIIYVNASGELDTNASGISWDNSLYNLSIGGEGEEALSIKNTTFYQEISLDPFSLLFSTGSYSGYLVSGMNKLFVISSSLYIFDFQSPYSVIDKGSISYTLNASISSINKSIVAGNNIISLASNGYIYITNTISREVTEHTPTDLGFSNIADIDVKNGYLYVAGGDEIGKFDISNIDNILEIELVQHSGTTFYSLSTIENYCYAIINDSSTYELAVYDSDNNFTQVLKTSESLSSSSKILDYSNKNLILNSGGDIHLYDITNLESPSLIDTDTTGSDINRAFIYNDIIIACDSNLNEILVYSFNASTISLMYNSDLSITPEDIYIKGNILVILSSSTLYFYEIDSFVTKSVDCGYLFSNNFISYGKIYSIGTSKVHGSVQIGYGGLHVDAGKGIASDSEVHIGGKLSFLEEQSDFRASLKGKRLQSKKPKLVEKARVSLSGNVLNSIDVKNQIAFTAGDYFSVIEFVDLDNPTVNYSYSFGYGYALNAGIFIKDSYAYCNMKETLDIFNISDLSNVEYSNFKNDNYSSAVGFGRYGDYLIINSTDGADKALTVYEIFDPTSPKEIFNSTEIEGDLFYIDNGICYVYSDFNSKIKLYDISDINNIEYIDETDTAIESEVGDFIVKGNLLFAVTLSTSKIIVYNISDILNPLFVSETIDSSLLDSNRIIIKEDYAFVCGTDTPASSITVIDISDISNMEIIGEIDFSGGALGVKDMVIEDDRLYVINRSTKEVAVYDISSFSLSALKTGSAVCDNLKVKEDINIEGKTSSYGLTSSGGIFISEGNGLLVENDMYFSDSIFMNCEYNSNENIGLDIVGKTVLFENGDSYIGFSTQDISAPSDIGIVRFYNGYMHVFTSDPLNFYCYSVNNKIDISSASSKISLLGTYTVQFSPADIVDVGYSGEYAFVVYYSGSGNRLKVLNIENPVSPSTADTITLLDVPSFIKINGQYAYIGYNSIYTIETYDISDPNNVTLYNSQDISQISYPSLMERVGNLFFVGAETSNTGIGLLQKDGDDFTFINSFGYSGSSNKIKMEIEGDFLYVLSSSIFAAIKISDIYNQDIIVTSSNSIYRYFLSGTARDFYILEQKAYVFTNNYVYILDISDPLSIQLHSRFDNPLDSTSGYLLSGNRIYGFNGSNIGIMEIKMLDAPSARISELYTNDMYVYDMVDVGRRIHTESMTIGPLGVYVDSGKGFSTDSDFYAQKGCIGIKTSKDYKMNESNTLEFHCNSLNQTNSNLKVKEIKTGDIESKTIYAKNIENNKNINCNSVISKGSLLVNNFISPSNIDIFDTLFLGETSYINKNDIFIESMSTGNIKNASINVRELIIQDINIENGITFNKKIHSNKSYIENIKSSKIFVSCEEGNSEVNVGGDGVKFIDTKVYNDTINCKKMTIKNNAVISNIKSFIDYNAIESIKVNNNLKCSGFIESRMGYDGQKYFLYSLQRDIMSNSGCLYFPGNSEYKIHSNWDICIKDNNFVIKSDDDNNIYILEFYIAFDIDEEKEFSIEVYSNELVFFNTELFLSKNNNIYKRKVILENKGIYPITIKLESLYKEDFSIKSESNIIIRKA